ncbi:hypothetical protein [Pollutibacter soli]|uniref:hypothetical protein n=1 Tax=Pollutibacter soli TaxID=3034157 RepID=UPI003013F43D
MKKCLSGLLVVTIFISCSKSNSDQQQSSGINVGQLTKHTWVLDSGVIIYNGMRSVQKPASGERWAAEFTASNYIIKIQNEPPEIRNYLFKAKDTVFYWDQSDQRDPDQYFLIKSLNAEKLVTHEIEQLTQMKVETYMHAE